MNGTYAFRPLTSEDVSAILTWRYAPPYDCYNLDPSRSEETRRYMMDPANHFHAMLNAQGERIGFCSFGRDGQVPGGEYEADALDIGMGIRPDLTGLGRGTSYARAVASYGRERYGAERLRVTIAGFNRRARRVWEKLGFRTVSAFRHPKRGTRFVILMLEGDLKPPPCLEGP